LSKFGQKEQAQSTDLIRRTQAVLGPMIARSASSQAAARDIDEQYASFHRSTDKVVVSLQSEDIARQRVEHVHEAVCRVANSLDAGESMESCAGVLAVQRSQLVSTRDLLAESIRTIHSALQSLSPRIEELVLRTTTLAQQTGEDGRSFATVIDSGLETVAAVFEQRSSSVKAIMEIVNSVVPEVEEMTRSGHALEKIEASIHLISLNATVKLGQLGKEGATMDVIASELRSITREGGGDTRVVLDGLAAISEALAKIVRVKVTSGSSLMMGGGEVVNAELSGLSQSVRISGQKMMEGLTQVRQLAVHASIVIELFNEQVRSFDSAFGQLGYTKEMATVAVVGDRQDDLSALYSMESERKLHLEVFGGEGNSAGNQGNREFGDDVELF